MERLTKKEYWELSWKEIRLPTGYLSDYSHKIIAKKITSIFSKENFKPAKMIELGGCPGRWADFFNKNYNSYCDSIDYGENNCEITRKNYKMLGIKGEVFNQDIFNNNLRKEFYDVVVSDGLIEHFTELDLIFRKHIELLKDDGFLIISVPNIKKSRFYNYFAKKDVESYETHRLIRRKDLLDKAREYNLEIAYCGHLGIFNFGLVRWNFIKNRIFKRCLDYFFQFFNLALTFVRIKNESNIFSPYIFLICKKSKLKKNTEDNEKIWDFYQTIRRDVFTKSSPRFTYLANKIMKFKKRGKYLDIGMGDGYLIREMANNNFECFGIDIAKESIEKNRRQFNKDGFSVGLKQGSIDCIPFENDSFDVITASEVMEHLDLLTLKNGITEIKRCLKNDGIFIATVPFEENLEDNLCFCPKCGSIFHKWGHQQSFSKDKLNYIFEEEFKYVAIRKILPVPYGQNVYELIKYQIKRGINLLFDNPFVGNFIIIAKK